MCAWKKCCYFVVCRLSYGDLWDSEIDPDELMKPDFDLKRDNTIIHPKSIPFTFVLLDALLNRQVSRDLASATHPSRFTICFVIAMTLKTGMLSCISSTIFRSKSAGMASASLASQMAVQPLALRAAQLTHLPTRVEHNPLR